MCTNNKIQLITMRILSAQDTYLERPMVERHRNNIAEILKSNVTTELISLAQHDCDSVFFGEICLELYKG
jgi:hypothetical protein